MVVSASVVLYVGLDLARFATFHSPAYDLGFFDQLASNLNAGRGWESSFIAYDFRGQHWEPILLVWAQLYRLRQSPVWLLLVSGVGLGLAPLAAWRLARRWFGAPSAVPLIAALATALSPLVLRTQGFDYHSETLTPLLALLAIEAAAARRWLGVAAACGVLILLKEDAFLVVAGIGWLTWRVDGRRGGLLLSAAALVGFAIVVGVYMPGLRTGLPSDLLARYGYLAAGHPVTPISVTEGIVTHPSLVLHRLLSSASRAGLGVALLPLALLPVLSGTAVLAVLPVLAIAMLSADPLQASLHLQYGAEAFPLLLACALVGLRRLQGLRARAAPSLLRAGVPVAVVGMLAAVALAVDLPARVRDAGGWSRVSAVQGVLDRVPPGAAVSASTDLVAHLSERPSIREFPDVGTATWVVIDSVGAPSSYSLAAGYVTAVAGLPRTFHVVASGGGVSLWERT